MKLKIYQTTIESTLGKITIAASDKGLCLLEFDNQKRITHHIEQIKKYRDIQLLENKSNNILSSTQLQIEEFLTNKRTSFNIALDLYGTDFQLKVWNELLNISYGVTRSYKEQAIAIGDLKAIRAVATANGQNRVSIVIPCHRVIGSDGSLTGYGGELWRKKMLLELESNQAKLF